MKTLAERLKKSLKAAKIGPTNFAQLAGLSPSAVTALCQGRIRTLTSENLYKAAAILDVSPRWLATGKGARRIGDKDADIVHLSDFNPVIARLFTAMRNLPEHKLLWLEMFAQMLMQSDSVTSINKVLTKLKLPTVKNKVSTRRRKRAS